MGRLAATHMQSGPDPKTMMWSLIDLSRNLLRQPLALFDGSVFYPYDRTIATVDHQLGNALLAAPLTAVGVDSVLVYNFVFLATFVLTGLFTCLLVKRLSGSLAAGLLAGFALAFSTARVYTLPHVHLLGAQFVPLALLALHRFGHRPTLRRWIPLAGAAALVALSSWHIAVLGGLTLAVVGLVTWIAAGSRRTRLALGLAGAAAVCGALLLPIAGVYMEVGARWPPAGGRGPTVEVAERNAADLLDLGAMPADSRSRFTGHLARLGPATFPGVVTLLLALGAAVSLIRGRGRPRLGAGSWIAVLAALPAVAIVGAALLGRQGLVASLRPLAPFVWLTVGVLIAVALAARRLRDDSNAPERCAPLAYLALALVGVLLSFGPAVTLGGVDLGSGAWRLDLLPVPLLLRAPVRFALLTALGLAMFLGLGLARWLQELPPRTRVVTAALLLVALNLDLAFAVPELNPSPRPTEADHWLAASDEEGAVLEYPLTSEGNWWSIYHSQDFYHRRNVEGHGYMRPPEVRRLRELRSLSREQLELIWEYSHPTFIVVRGDLMERAQRRRTRRAIEALEGALEPVVREGPDQVYRLHDYGAGPLLSRRWPAAQLRDSSGTVVLQAALGEGRAGTTGLLRVELNGRTLLERPAEGVVSRSILRFEPADLVPGENVFTLRGGYRLEPGFTPRALGDTGLTVAADLEVSIDPDRAQIVVNGALYRSGAGSLLVAIDAATGSVIDWAEVLGREPWLARDAADRVARLPAGTVLAVAQRATAPLPPALARELALEAATEPAGPAVALMVKGATWRTGLVEVGAETASLTLGEPEVRRVRLRGFELR